MTLFLPNLSREMSLNRVYNPFLPNTCRMDRSPLKRLYDELLDDKSCALFENWHRSPCRKDLCKKKLKDLSSMKFNFAGFDPKKIKVDVYNNTLKLEATEKDNGSFRYIKYERNLPEETDPDHISACMSPGGILTITFDDKNSEIEENVAGRQKLRGRRRSNAAINGPQNYENQDEETFKCETSLKSNSKNLDKSSQSISTESVKRMKIAHILDRENIIQESIKNDIKDPEVTKTMHSESKEKDTPKSIKNKTSKEHNIERTSISNSKDDTEEILSDDVSSDGKSSTSIEDEQICKSNASDPFIIDLDFSGFKPENIIISISGNTVRIEAEQEEEGSCNLHTVYERKLPESTDKENISATFNRKNGILKIKAPSRKNEHDSIEIPIQRMQLGTDETSNKKKE